MNILFLKNIFLKLKVVDKHLQFQHFILDFSLHIFIIYILSYFMFQEYPFFTTSFVFMICISCVALFVELFSLTLFENDTDVFLFRLLIC